MKKQKGIDDIFRHSLQDPVNEPEFAEHDWNALENMLDKSETGGKIAWLRYLSAAAAIIAIAFCWWIFKPAANTQKAQQVVKNKPAANGPAAADKQMQQPVIANQPKTFESNIAAKSSAGPADKISAQQKNKSNMEVAGTHLTDNKKLSQPQSGLDEDHQLVTGQDMGVLRLDDVITAASPSFNVAPLATINTPALALAEIPSQVTVRPLAIAQADLKRSTTSAFRPQFALTVLASPELNGIGSFKSGSRGNNIGLMFTAGIKKLSFSTGINYTVKPYTLPYSQYPSSYNYKNAPETVTADCRMLDIPINIGYQLFNKSGNKITLGTGVSSYIMTHESYTYDYAASSKKVYGPSYYQVEGKGKYAFSIMNLQATYERRLNSKFGLSLQPYFKIPLSEIGYSQVRVQTFGVAVGLNWNINPLTKPK